VWRKRSFAVSDMIVIIVLTLNLVGMAYRPYGL
jgi:hypothetical protein